MSVADIVRLKAGVSSWQCLRLKAKLSEVPDIKRLTRRVAWKADFLSNHTQRLVHRKANGVDNNIVVGSAVLIMEHFCT